MTPARKSRQRDVAVVKNAPGGRETILRVAATLFATKGYAESGLREIAQLAGIRASTVYYHFESKERIYEEIIRMAIDTIADAIQSELDALAPDATPRLRIETAIAGHLRALHANKPFTSTNAHARIKLPSEIQGVIAPMRDRYSNFWRAMLDEARLGGWLKPAIETRMLRPLILGTLNRTVGWFDPEQGAVDTLIRTTIAMFAGIWNDPAPVRAVRAVRKRQGLRARALRPGR